MALIDPQQAQEDFEKEQERRKQSFTQLKQIRDLAAQGVTEVQKANQKGTQAMGQRSAQALAATLGQVGGAPTGGGQVATLRQAAATRSVNEATLGMQQAKELAAARSAAAEKAFETLSAEEALGSLTKDRQQKMTAFEQNLANLQQQYLSGTLGIGDDVSSFVEAAKGLMSTENDQALRVEMEKRIQQIAAANDDFNFLSFSLYPIIGSSAGDINERI